MHFYKIPLDGMNDNMYSLVPSNTLQGHSRLSEILLSFKEELNKYYSKILIFQIQKS